MEQLDALLDQVAAALIAGDFDTLNRLTPQIESQDLVETDRRTAEALQAKAMRNARLLDAAARGVRSAALRYSEATRGPTLTTYDARGQRAQIDSIAEVRLRRV